MIDPDLSERPYADHWRAALEAFLRRLVLIMALALSLPPPKPRALPSGQIPPARSASPAPPAARRPQFTVPLEGSAVPGADHPPAPPSGPASASPLAGIITQSGFLLRIEKLAALIADPDPVVRRLALRLRARERPPGFAVADADLPNPHTSEAWTFPPPDTS